VMVDNDPGFEAVITPQYVVNLEAAAKRVAEILNIPANEIVRTVKKAARKDGRYRAVRIKENLSRDEVTRMERIRLDYPGVDINMFIKHTYPQKEIGAQLLGYVAEISKSQLPIFNKNKSKNDRFRQGDLIGKNGIEKSFDQSLRGE